METRENIHDYSCSHNNVSASQRSSNRACTEPGVTDDAPGVNDDDTQGQNCANTDHQQLIISSVSSAISVHSDTVHTAAVAPSNIYCCPFSDLHNNNTVPPVANVTECQGHDTADVSTIITGQSALIISNQLTSCSIDQSACGAPHSVPDTLSQQQKPHTADDMHDQVKHSTSNTCVKIVLQSDQTSQQNQQMPNQTQPQPIQPQNQPNQNQPQIQYNEAQSQLNQTQKQQTQAVLCQNETCISEEHGEHEETDTIQLRHDGQMRSARLHNVYSDLLTSGDLRRRRSTTVMEAKQHAFGRLQHELNNAQTELRLKDEECDKLAKVRDQMEIELEDLTASLFEEANNMVQEANIKRMHSEKLLTEANNKIEILQAEVTALKALVLTSTPSSPNKHLHPQIDKLPPPIPPMAAAAHTASSQPAKKTEKRPFWKGHRRSTSHHEFTKEARQQAEAWQNNDQNRISEVDPVCFEEFRRWRNHPELNREGPFLSRIIIEDITPCLSFNNKQLSVQVQQCVQNNTLMIEPIKGDESTLPRNCSLSETCKLCNFKIHLGDDGLWMAISQHCRNRIAAVCDFFAYIRYIIQGLVKSEERDSYNEVVKLRRQMALARLGYT